MSFGAGDQLFNYGRAYYQQRYESLESETRIPTVHEVLHKAAPPDSSPGTLPQICRLLQLTDLLPLEVMKLSNGQTRKVLIARVLLRQPALLLLDNPFTGLDVKARKDLQQIMNTLVAQGTPVIVVTNQTRLPESVTHVLWLENFRIKGVYAKAAFLKEPANSSDEKAARIEINQSPLTIMPKPAPPYKIAIKFEEVSVRYGGKKVLDDINWTIRQGEKWALLGPNGSGKSTLLSLINADNPQAYANKIFLFDRRKGSGESIWEIKKRIGFVSPELHLYFRENLSAAEVAASGFFDVLYRPKKLTNDQRQLISQHFAFFNRSDLADQPFLRLSTGEQRLILLIRSLVKNPELIIWDEPFQNLSPDYIEIATTLLHHYCTPSTTLLFVSHYQHEIPAFVDQYLYLEAGRIRKLIPSESK